jgi:hypothetical protein
VERVRFLRYGEAPRGLTTTVVETVDAHDPHVK